MDLNRLRDLTNFEVIAERAGKCIVVQCVNQSVFEYVIRHVYRPYEFVYMRTERLWRAEVVDCTEMLCYVKTPAEFDMAIFYYAHGESINKFLAPMRMSMHPVGLCMKRRIVFNEVHAILRFLEIEDLGIRPDPEELHDRMWAFQSTYRAKELRAHVRRMESPLQRLHVEWKQRFKGVRPQDMPPKNVHGYYPGFIEHYAPEFLKHIEKEHEGVMSLREYLESVSDKEMKTDFGQFIQAMLA